MTTTPLDSERPLQSAPVLEIAYHAAQHAAVRTQDYLFSQLIPYLGNKRKLLPLIADAVDLTGVRSGTFADVFAGSGVVSRWAKRQGFRTVSNDWEPYAKEINGCAIGLNRRPPVDLDLFEKLNALPGQVGHVTRNYCPSDDQCPEPLRERCFFTRANGMKIDSIRQQIADWEGEGRLTNDERAYLLAPLLYSASYVSNTSGVFKAYHHGWGGATKTALYRILSDFHLSEPVLLDNGRNNLSLQLDAQDLANSWNEIAGSPLDIAYLDPPYNQHPYGSNYHMLNTLALWDDPPVSPIGRGTKSAIRTDWRSLRRSAYNSTALALPALARLVESLPARWVLLSYSTDGNMSSSGLLETMSAFGKLTVVTRRYKRYRVSTPRMSERPHTVEFVLVLDKRTPGPAGQVDRIREEINAAEQC